MIKDVSGIELIPGNMGKNCPGNGNYFNDLGEIIICCDECDYLICCSDANNKKNCRRCNDTNCPHSRMNKKFLKILKKVLTKRFIRVTIDKLSLERALFKRQQ